MSTATGYDRAPLYAVPGQPTMERFALLLALRAAARRTFDQAIAVPRAALGWVLRHLHAIAAAAADVRGLTRLGGLGKSALATVREVGIIPTAVAVLSTPVVAAHVLRAAKAVGRGLVRLARSAWAGTQGLLSRGGSTGENITSGITSAGTTVAAVARRVLRHPVTQQVLPAFAAAATLTRPVSHALLAHRVLARLIPAAWLRVLLEAVLVPFVVDPSLAGRVGGAAAPRRGQDPTHAAGRPQGTRTAGKHRPFPATTVAAEPGEPAATPKLDNLENPWDTWDGKDLQPLNRAERRAHQRTQAQAKRSTTHR